MACLWNMGVREDAAVFSTSSPSLRSSCMLVFEWYVCTVPASSSCRCTTKQGGGATPHQTWMKQGGGATPRNAHETTTRMLHEDGKERRTSGHGIQDQCYGNKQGTPRTSLSSCHAPPALPTRFLHTQDTTHTLPITQFRVLHTPSMSQHTHYRTATSKRGCTCLGL